VSRRPRSDVPAYEESTHVGGVLTPVGAPIERKHKDDTAKLRCPGSMVPGSRVTATGAKTYPATTVVSDS